MRDTKTIGDLSELIVALRLAQAGYTVARPYEENCRYDLLVDDGCRISRVQVKTGRLRNGAIVFNTYSTHGHRKGVACRPYTNQVDFFGVYCPQTNSAYLIPIEDTRPFSASLRLHATKNAQDANVRWAHRYLIGVERTPELFAVGPEVVGVVTESGSALPS